MLDIIIKNRPLSGKSKTRIKYLANKRSHKFCLRDLLELFCSKAYFYGYEYRKINQNVNDKVKVLPGNKFSPLI